MGKHIDPMTLSKEELAEKLVEFSGENNFLMEKIAEQITETFNVMRGQINTLKVICLRNHENQGMIDAFNKVTDSMIETFCELLISDKEIEDVRKLMDDE